MHIALVEEALGLVFPTDTFEHQPLNNLDELFTDSQGRKRLQVGYSALVDEHNIGA